MLSVTKGSYIASFQICISFIFSYFLAGTLCMGLRSKGERDIFALFLTHQESVTFLTIKYDSCEVHLFWALVFYETVAP